MFIVFDCGNTHTCIGVFQGESIQDQPLHSWRIVTDSKRSPQEWETVILKLLSSNSLSREDIVGAVISSVVPDALGALKTMADQLVRGPVYVIGSPGVDLGVQALIENPEELGADLMVNSLGAHRLYGGPLIIVDFGTVTTFSVVDENGNYCGGAFVPGVKMGLQALASGTAQLPLISFEKPLTPHARCTQSALQAGIYWGTLGQFQAVTEALQKNLNPKKPLPVIVTGGMSRFFVDELKGQITYDPNLTLKGLAIAGHVLGLGSQVLERKFCNQ